MRETTPFVYSEMKSRTPPGIDTGKESIFFYRYKPLRSM